jgi:hypothetical protein
MWTNMRNCSTPGREASIIHRVAFARRLDGFPATSTDFLLREQFITDPTKITSDYLYGESESAQRASINQLVYSSPETWDPNLPARLYDSTSTRAIAQRIGEPGSNKRRQGRSILIPYRQNRAIIFNSDLFHATAELRFRLGYDNRRINVTMLYGYRQCDVHHSGLAGVEAMSAGLNGASAWRSTVFTLVRKAGST